MNPLINTGIGDKTTKIVAATNLKLYILYIPYIASTGDRFYSISVKGSFNNGPGEILLFPDHSLVPCD